MDAPNDSYRCPRCGEKGHYGYKCRRTRQASVPMLWRVGELENKRAPVSKIDDLTVAFKNAYVRSANVFNILASVGPQGRLSPEYKRLEELCASLKVLNEREIEDLNRIKNGQCPMFHIHEVPQKTANQPEYTVSVCTSVAACTDTEETFSSQNECDTSPRPMQISCHSSRPAERQEDGEDEHISFSTDSFIG